MLIFSNTAVYCALNRGLLKLFLNRGVHLQFYSLILLALVSFNASAEFGLKNFHEVMPGALYRGGGTGGRQPVSTPTLRSMCDGGIRSAVYLYRTGFNGPQTESCGSGQISYKYIQWDRNDRAILTELHKMIVEGRGPMYVHCWYGVHASGYISAVALKQFCGYSDSEALDYWNSYVAKKIRYPKIQNMVVKFQPYPELNISAAQAAKVCPK